MPINTQIQLRADLAATWTAVNPILEAGEIGIESDTGNLKAGDGATAWNTLDYSSDPTLLVLLNNLTPAAIGAAPIDSPVFIGNPQGPTPLAGDYDTSFATTQFVVDAINLAVSGPGTLVPTNTAVPVITLAATTAVSSNGLWTRSPTFYNFQWASSPNINGSSPTNITVVGSGFNTSTYTIQAGDIGNVLMCYVTATNGNGASIPALSRPTAPIQGTTAAPVNTVAPVITGSAIQGQTLITSNGTWTGSPTFTYQWAQLPPGGSGAGLHIAGATSNTYVLQASDVGQTIYSIVTGTNIGGFDIGYSPVTGTVTGSGTGPVNTVPPTVTGSPIQAQILTAHNGTWTGTAPITYTYQWQTLVAGTVGPGTNIAGATSGTFTLTSSQLGLVVRVNVIATNASGATTVSSASTNVITSSGSGPLIWDGTYSGTKYGVADGQPPSRGNFTYQSFVPGHVTVQPDPLGNINPSTGLVVRTARYAITNNDRPYVQNPIYAARGDLASPNVYAEGSITYTSVPILCLHTDLPLFGTARTNFFQWAESKDTTAGTWGWSMNIANSGGVNHWMFGLTFNYYWTSTLAYDNLWHTATIRQLSSAKSTGGVPNGWAELWWDGVKQTFNNGSTRITGINTITDGVASWPVDLNMYRAINMYSGTINLYHGPAKVGPDSGGVPATESGRPQGP